MIISINPKSIWKGSTPFYNKSTKGRNRNKVPEPVKEYLWKTHR